MNIKQAFPSQYITAEDLQGRDVPVQIAGCRMEPVKQESGPDKDKPVLYFTGHQRGLVLNVTNGLAIASLYGDETDAWVGKWITLYPTQCQFGAKLVDCIRVRPFPPTNGAAPPPLASQQPPPPQAFTPPAQPTAPSPQPPLFGHSHVQF
ncbi:MAG: hypothetical protein AB7I48_23805 [Planctomycetaceae bacterium]